MYYNVTQESIVITLLFRACNLCDVLYFVTLIMIPCNDPGYDKLPLLKGGDVTRAANQQGPLIGHRAAARETVLQAVPASDTIS
jgi:hypothetical protein